MRPPVHVGRGCADRSEPPGAARPRDATTGATGATVTISLCIVARNEAHFIARAIASARAVVDQIVVVDTGSTDGTPDLARQAGAEVDVCAVARRSRAGARSAARAGDGRLDSRARCGRGARPVGRRRACACWCRDADGYRFTVRNYDYRPGLKWRTADPGDPLTLGAPGWSPSRAMRFFRNDGRYRNRGRLHQIVHLGDPRGRRQHRGYGCAHPSLWDAAPRSPERQPLSSAGRRRSAAMRRSRRAPGWSSASRRCRPATRRRHARASSARSNSPAIQPRRFILADACWTAASWRLPLAMLAAAIDAQPPRRLARLRSRRCLGGAGACA